VPPIAPGPVPALDPDRHGRRAVWISLLVTAILAGCFYWPKAAEERSAFIRWRHQVRQFWQGENIWDTYMFPNPPILPISLYPLMALDPVAGALSWFALKVALTGLSILLCFRMARPWRWPLPSWVQGLIVLLSLRPILSDLHHGNINLLILFLIVATLTAWRKGYDVLAGLTLALAITYKVTPALFVPYFLYKRSYRVVGATGLGIGIFLLVVPGLVLGPSFNGQCLAMWWHRILSPYLAGSVVGDLEINQSMVGVLTRLLTEAPPAAEPSRYALQVDVNLVAWDRAWVVALVKGLSLALVALLTVFCRTRTHRRDDARLLGEFSLVVLTMLFVSERSWKHHYVTLLLPYTYLVCRLAAPAVSWTVRGVLAAALAASAVLMATTSSEISRLFTHGQAHKVAQGYGMFFWAGVVLYAATAWRVVVEGRTEPAPDPARSQPHRARSTESRAISASS
jgi:alpha-1,2-mannosyltransferase